MVSSIPFDAAYAAGKGHKLTGSAELQFRTNDNITVAPSSADSFDFADFADFAEAEAKDGEDDEDEEDEDEDEDDEGDEGDEGEDDFGSDDFDDIGLDDTDFSEDEFDLATDDDDGDGSEDDEDDDGVDDPEDPDDPDPNDPDPDGKRGNDNELDELINSLVIDKAGARKQSQNRWGAKFGVSHKFAFDNGFVSWGSTAKVGGDFHPGKDSLDKLNLALSTGPEFNLKDIGLKIKPALSYVLIRQHGNNVVSTLVGTLAASYEINKKWDVTGAYNYQDRDITDPDSPDAIVNTLTFGAQFTATKKDIFKFRFSPKVEDSSKVTKNKDTDGWQITYSRKLPWDMILGIGAKNDSVDFVNLPVRREDDVRAYSLDLAKQFSKAFEMGLSYETRDLDSNINTKDAENKSIMISGVWKF